MSAKQRQYHITLAFFGADVQPDEIARDFELTFDSSFAYRRGDLYDVDGVLQARESGCVILHSQPRWSDDFERLAQRFLDHIEPREHLLASAAARGWELHLMVLTITDAQFGGPQVHPQTMKRFAALNLITTWKTGFATNDDAFST